jgi:hypothetical protein
MFSISISNTSETPINTGVARGAEFRAKIIEYFEILVEYFPKLMPF